VTIPTRVADAVYRTLLWLFPSQIRHRYGSDMTIHFARQRCALRGRPIALVLLWIRVMLETARHGVGLRFGSLRWPRGLGDLVWNAALVSVWRQLRSSDRVGILLLSVGFGLTSAAVYAVWIVFFSNLPFLTPSELAQIGTTSTSSIRPLPVSAARAIVIETLVGPVATTFAYSSTTVAVEAGDRVVSEPAALVTPGAFTVLGPHVFAGRDIARHDGTKGAAPVLVVSLRRWKTLFGEAPFHRVFLRIDGIPREVIGVAGSALPSTVDFFIPVNLVDEGDSDVARWAVVGRRSSRYSLAQLQGLLSTDVSDTAEGTPGRSTLLVTPLAATLRAPYAGPLTALTIATGLLVAATVAVLAVILLAANEGVRRELALRSLLGGSTVQAVLLVLSRSAAISVAVGVGAIVPALLLTYSLKRLFPPTWPNVDSLQASWPLAGVTVVTSALIGVLAASPALLRLRKLDLSSALRQQPGSLSYSATSRTMRVLICAFAFVSVVSLAGALAGGRAYTTLLNADLGYRPEGLITIDLSQAHFDWAQRQDWTARFVDSLASLRLLPGIHGVAGASQSPVGLGSVTTPVSRLPDHEPSDVRAGLWLVTPGFFELLGLQLIEGQTCANYVPTGDRGVVITKTAATTYWPSGAPLGRRLSITTGEVRRVIGVVSDFRVNPTAHLRPELFECIQDRPTVRMFALVKLSGEADLSTIDLSGFLRSRNPEFGVGSPSSVSTQLERFTGQPRLTASIMTIFASMVICIGGSGVVAVARYACRVDRSGRAVRAALGATPVLLNVQAALSVTKPAALGLVVGGAFLFLASERLKSALPLLVLPSLPIVVTTVTFVGVLVFVSAYATVSREAADDYGHIRLNR